ncbi:MAG: hypothetical protein AMJ72_05410 [Acidithiobacillales bacterium SM1_46]|nr:MAG: hypothetical protein AMJ72_05410 [Acidithiobacillales bacterium SM1_46]
MSDIVVTMKDGTVRKFMHEGRPGGSYTKRLSFEGGVAIITDEWYKKTCIPVEDIKEIECTPERS